MFILNIIRGVFMAFADSVPGVSGGTIAFIMGFYNELILSINSLISKKNVIPKKQALRFLLTIGLGWIIGIILSVLFIASIFEEEIYAISSLFIGFILFSIPVIIKQEKTSIYNHKCYIPYLLLGILIVSVITYFNPLAGGSKITFSFYQLSPWLAVYVFLSGMIAISAMILPGISGSTLLLIMGLYTHIIGAVKQILLFDFSIVPVLLIFICGIFTGILFIVKLLSQLLKNHRPQMIYLILGLMIGSIYAVIMGPMTLENSLPPLSFTSFHWIAFFIGGVTILLLELFQKLIKQ